MKRRDFLKFLGFAPLAPSVLMAKEVKRATSREITDYDDSTKTATISASGDGWTYLYVSVDMMGAFNDDCVVTLYSCLQDGACKRIDNCHIVNTDDGMCRITIPKEIL